MTNRPELDAVNDFVVETTKQVAAELAGAYLARSIPLGPANIAKDAVAIAKAVAQELHQSHYKFVSWRNGG